MRFGHFGARSTLGELLLLGRAAREIDAVLAAIAPLLPSI